MLATTTNTSGSEAIRCGCFIEDYQLAKAIGALTGTKSERSAVLGEYKVKPGEDAVRRRAAHSLTLPHHVSAMAKITAKKRKTTRFRCLIPDLRGKKD